MRNNNAHLGKRPNPLLDRLLKTCVPQPTTQDLLRAATAGDEAAAWMLLDTTLDQAVDVVIELCRRNASRRLFRQILSNVHAHQPERLKARHPGAREVLRALYGHAAFELPDKLPEVVTLWRGTSGVDAEEARSGFFWSGNLETAQCFSMRNASESSRNIVVEARVRREAISRVGSWFGVVDPKWSVWLHLRQEFLLLEPPVIEAVSTLPVRSDLRRTIIDPTPEQANRAWREHVAFVTRFPLYRSDYAVGGGRPGDEDPMVRLSLVPSFEGN